MLLFMVQSKLNQSCLSTRDPTGAQKTEDFIVDMVSIIEKAIITSNLGLNPAVSGMNIRVPLPALTEERRKDLIKVVRNEGENARVAIRNIRRDANNDLKTLNKEKDITDDELHKAEDDMQKLTDKYVKEVDTLLSAKEKDLMEF